MKIKERFFKGVRRISFLVALLVVITSCQEYKKIVVSDVQLDAFTFKNTTSAQIDISVFVDNPTKAVISIVEADAVLKKEGKDFILLDIPQEYSVAPESKGRIGMKVEASALNPIEIIATGLNIASWDLNEFTVDGKIVVKSNKGFKKVFRLKNEPLKDVLDVLVKI